MKLSTFKQSVHNFTGNLYIYDVIKQHIMQSQKNSFYYKVSFIQQSTEIHLQIKSHMLRLRIHMTAYFFQLQTPCISNGVIR